MQLFILMMLSCIISTQADCDSEREAFVLTAASEAEIIQSLVALRSLRAVGTSKEVVLVTNSNYLSQQVREFALREFSQVYEVALPEWMSPPDKRLSVIVRPEAQRSLLAAYVWRLTKFRKLVLLTPNMIAVKPCDELLLQPSLSAVEDKLLPDLGLFDSSMIVLQPSLETYERLMTITRATNFTWNDESIFNSAFPTWHKLSDDYCSLEYKQSANGTHETNIDGTTRLVSLHEQPAPWSDIYNEGSDVLITDSKFPQLSARRLWWSVFTTLQRDFAEQQGVSTVADVLKKETQNKNSGALGIAKSAHLRKSRFRRAIGGCSISCWKGSCSCGGHSCLCRCRFGRPVCSSAVIAAPTSPENRASTSLSFTG